MREISFDANGYALGRLATEVARTLQGKDKPGFAPNRVAEVKVTIKNAHLVKISGAKAEQKVYYRHTGRPGHLKTTRYKDVIVKNPEWVIRHAVLGMLPKNRLRAQRIKKLVFEKHF